MARDERVYIRVSTEEKDKLQKLADKDNRSLSDYIRVSILENIEEEEKMETRIKYFTKSKKTGETAYTIIPKGHVKNIDSDDNFIIWTEDIPYKVMYITDTLEEMLHECTNAQEAVETAEREWYHLLPSDKKRARIEVREMIDDYETEKGEVIYNYNLIWESK